MLAPLQALLRRLGSFVGRRRIESRLRDELQFHADCATAAHERNGASPDEARRRARLDLGGFDRAREEYRDALGFRPFDDLGHDLRLALRGLRRSPAFAAVAAATLALGIGANTLLFNAIYALLWRPLPFPDEGRLVALTRQAERDGEIVQATGSELAWIHDHVASIDSVGLAAGREPMGIVLASGPVDLECLQINSGYLRALGVRPLLGRLFGDDEDRQGSSETTALLTQAAWHRYFGADPSLVGKTVPSLDGRRRRPVRIVGILPDNDALPYAAGVEIFTSVPWLHQDIRGNRGTSQFRTVLRVRAGVTLTQASSDVTAAMMASVADLPPQHRGGRRWIIPLREALLAGGRTPFWMLYAAAGLLLVLTTANVASLFLARALARRHETAVRAALGASLRHALRAQFAEALLVCLTGLAAALVLNQVLQPLVPKVLPELRAVGPQLLRTGHVLIGFGIVCCLAVAGALALLPALLRRRVPVVDDLSAAGRGATARSRGREALAAVQIAVILVLLVVGSLIGRSFVSALWSDSGFDPTGVITFKASLPVAEEARVATAYEMMEAIASVPGISRAAFSFESPLGGVFSARHTTGGEVQASSPMVLFRLTSSGYLETLGAHLVRGRLLTEAEVRSTSLVTVINESAERLLFGGQNAVGRSVRSAMGNALMTVVGVVRDMRTAGLDEAPPPTLYRPYMPFFGSGIVCSVRTTEPLDRIMPAIGQRIRGWNSAVVVRTPAVLDAALRRTIQPRLRAAFLVGAFALLGLMVGTVGLYGTLAADVDRRARELGIRLALGASTTAVLGRIAGHGARLVAVGVVVGLAGSAGAVLLVRRYLFGIAPWDGASFMTAVALLAVAAAGAVLLPAVRAARIDPAATLRQQ